MSPFCPALEILWLGGEKARMTDVQADQTLTIKEPAEVTSPLP
jgi:hypothetical protein